MSQSETVLTRHKTLPSIAGWKTVLVHVEPAASSAPRLEAAVALARRCDAMLIGLGAEMVEPVAFADCYGGADGLALTALREVTEANLARAETLFRQAASGGLSEWRSVEDRPAEAMSRVARGADVVVAGGGCSQSPAHGADAAELALKCGRPVLVVPEHGGELAAERVVVAWKDTREARRALADAMPLLRAAREVQVVEVCAKDEFQDAKFRTGDVAAALQRHGVTARAHAVGAPDDRAGELIREEAKRLDADLVVAGCYGHSRLNEWVFGGVTRDLLEADGPFLLLSH